MKRRLPPLNAVRAFEVAARHGSFVQAAEELAVTPAAVSHQVKSLEDFLGLSLFVRHHRSVDLTPVGQALLPGLSDAFERMGRSIDDVLKQAKGLGPLTVRAPTAFASKWLMPRLERFYQIFPDVAVRLQTDGRLLPEQAQDEADQVEDDVDLVLRCRPLVAGRGGVVSSVPGTGWEGVPLFSERLFPVCAPVLRMGLSAPANLTRQTLLTDEGHEGLGEGSSGWAGWLAVAGVTGLKPASLIPFRHYTQSLDAAQRGQGVALGRGALVEAELKSGLLVRPFQITAASGVIYSLDWPRHRLRRPEAVTFCQWLEQEAAAFRLASPQTIDPEVS